MEQHYCTFARPAALPNPFLEGDQWIYFFHFVWIWCLLYLSTSPFFCLRSHTMLIHPFIHIRSSIFHIEQQQQNKQGSPDLLLPIRILKFLLGSWGNSSRAFPGQLGYKSTLLENAPGCPHSVTWLEYLHSQMSLRRPHQMLEQFRALSVWRSSGSVLWVLPNVLAPYPLTNEWAQSHCKGNSVWSTSHSFSLLVWSSWLKPSSHHTTFKVVRGAIHTTWLTGVTRFHTQSFTRRNPRLV